MWRFTIGTVHHTYQDARLQVLTVALLDPEDKGTAIFKTKTTKLSHPRTH